MADRLPPPPPEATLPKPPPEATAAPRDEPDAVKQELMATFPGATGSTGYELLPYETAKRDPMREIKQRFIVPGAAITGIPGLRQVAEFVTPGTVPELATTGIMGLPGRGLAPLASKVLASAATGVKGGLSERGEVIKTGLMGLLGAGAAALWDPAFRAGSYAYKRYGSEIADKIVKEAKDLVGWWKDLPTGHEGVQALVRDGVGRLQEGYGKAVAAAFGESLRGQKIPLAVEDAARLALAPASKPFVEGTILVDAEQAVHAAALQGHSAMGQVIEDRVRGAIGQLVEALRPSRPEAAAQIGEALSGKAPAAARAAYREGMNFLNALMKANVLDPATKLVDPRQFIMGLDRSFSVGGAPSNVWRRFLGPSRAPEARAAIERTIPKGTPAPEEVGVPFVSAWLGHGARFGERLPLSVGYKHVPQTASEVEATGWVPPAVAALTGRLGSFGELAESISP